MSIPAETIAIVTVCLASAAGVLIRPWRLPEAIWACAGAGVLVIAGLLAPRDALGAIARGRDVYLFLVGMMLLSELARREGLFDWLAVHAIVWARGSPARLFTLIYGIGVVVTTFLSNDATAVVMTPAVYAAARRAEADPLPALFACAFVASAASFVLPISNPANIVLYGGVTPRLGDWFAAFGLPALLAIVATFLTLRWLERPRLAGACRSGVELEPLSGGGKLALAGIASTAIVLLTASALGWRLGPPTFLAGLGTALPVWLHRPRKIAPTLRHISWSVLPLVAGLFVLVAGLEQSGLIAALAQSLSGSPRPTAAGAGVVVAVAANLVNNLPAGLVASHAIAAAHPPALVTDALLIGVDLGPNLSITGSLATILWLAAIRREGADVSFWHFLRVGMVVMPPALALALAARIALG